MGAEATGKDGLRVSVAAIALILGYFLQQPKIP